VTDLILAACGNSNAANVNDWREYLNFAGREQECADEVLKLLLSKLEQEVASTGNAELLRQLKVLLQFTLQVAREFPLVTIPNASSSARSKYVFETQLTDWLLHCTLSDAAPKLTDVLNKGFGWVPEEKVRLPQAALALGARSATADGSDRPASDGELFDTRYRQWFLRPLPSYLLVVLGRSCFVQGKLLRITTKCEPALKLSFDKLVFGSERLVFTATGNAEDVYELCAAVVHVTGASNSSANGGHYFCLKKNLRGLWYVASIHVSTLNHAVYSPGTSWMMTRNRQSRRIRSFR